MKMSKSKRRRLILEREESFTRWHTAAIEFVSSPPPEITSWSQLPPFPQGCVPGVPISKTTVRIPQNWRERKEEYVMRLASFLLSYSYNIYENTALTAFAFTPSPTLGIVKQCGEIVAIYWFEFTIEGGLVQITSRKSIYSSNTPVLQPIMPGAAQAMIAQNPSKMKEMKILHKKHKAETEKALKETWTSWHSLIISAVFKTIGNVLKYIGEHFVLFFIYWFILVLLEYIIKELLDYRIEFFKQRDAFHLLILTFPLIVEYIYIVSRDINNNEEYFRTRNQYSLSLVYFPSSITTQQEIMNWLGHSDDLKVFNERVGLGLKQLQTFAENQE